MVEGVDPEQARAALPGPAGAGWAADRRHRCPLRRPLLRQGDPHLINRHAHPKAKPETLVAAPPAQTGIDYLRLIDTERTKELGQRINYEVFLPTRAQPVEAVYLSEEKP
ncbi:hypothetical protein ABZ934_26870 [Streptomyces sp. NPDC046557]|uniref:hypothetical protein n=1 Tax=Streptomyces sp. NPDC046557 TaxID=3155372 RepID=UPI0033EB7A80